MIRPIQFEKNGHISLNRLKLQIDRRVNLITFMVKKFKPNLNQKLCAQQSCQLLDKQSQTEQSHQPLCDLPYLFLNNTPPIKTIKSPTNLNKTSSKNKQNQTIHHSTSSNTNTQKPLLISIQQSQQQGLKTSRYLKKLESQKKKQKVKPSPLNISTSQKSDKSSIYGSKVGQKYKKIKINMDSEKKNDQPYVVNSFESNRKKNLTQKKTFKASAHKKLVKQPTTQDKLNLSFNSSIQGMSESKSKIETIKGSLNMNDSFIGSSAHLSKKYPSQSFSTNNNSSAFTTDDHYDDYCQRVKRMTIGQEVKGKVQQQFEKRLQANKKKIARQPKVSNNNIRVSLLKRLEDKHCKAHQVTK